MTWQIRENICLACGGRLNASATATPGPETPVRDGDPTLCLHCGHLMVFTDGLRLRNPSKEEAKDFNTWPELKDALVRVGRFRGHQ